MTKTHTLGRAERLKSRKLTEALFSAGSHFSLPGIRVCYVLEPRPAGAAGPAIQCGVTVSSRHFRKATDRNRIKRLLREAYRTQRAELQATLDTRGCRARVFFIFTGRELPDYEWVKQKLALTLNRLTRIVHEEYQPPA